MKYFVKLAGKAFGPLEEEKIVEMYNSGRLKDPVEISRDKKSWESIDIILPPPPPPDLPPVEPFVSTPTVEQNVQKPVDSNASVWYYSADGAKGYGPVTKSDLGTMLQCGMLKSSSLVWRQGENSRPISAAPELIDILVAGSSAASAGAGNGFVPPIPTSSDNSSFNGAFSFNPMKKPDLGAFSSTPTGNPGTNMFDLLDDPNFGNDGLGQGRASNQPSVGQISRTSYLLLALFLGQLGIHNFYASRMDIAIVQLFVGLSNLVGLIVISFVSLATEGQGRFLFIIPAIIGVGLEIWAIIEACIVTSDGSGKRMF
ncbi:MAG: DUF4339 domain-containing protein [Thermoguttaceae bacterium]|nr:DUF4339 domain-containing protein [Thermoguttaceae bacterium]